MSSRGTRRQKFSEKVIRTLPKSGCDLPAPDWPLINEPSKDELSLWLRLWKRPQAVVWHELQSYEPVARYVAQSVLSQHQESSATLIRELRALEASLGLSPESMHKLGWAIEDDSQPTNPWGTPDYDLRERFKPRQPYKG